MTRIGIVAELGRETRVAATPVTVRQMVELGYEVVVEKGLSRGLWRTGLGCEGQA